ncbi:MAG: TetR/AcrR family transcriptional regulator [Pseudomonadota bacterium]
MTDARSRALAACLETALSFGTLNVGLREYERQTDVSARMLVHYFRDKDGLKAALLEEIEARLRSEIEGALQDGRQSLSDVATAFSRPDRASLRCLLRVALHDALGGDNATSRVLLEERRRWRQMLNKIVPKEEVEKTLFCLVGAAVDALLSDPIGDFTN